MTDFYVVGGGPSLAGFDFERLRERRCIAVNASYLDLPWAEALVFSDQRFIDWNIKRPEWSQFKGKKVTTWRRPPEGAVRLDGDPYGSGLSHNPRVLAGLSSGTKALNYAYHLGATRIFMLGFDMRPNGNYHDRHQMKNRQGMYTEFLADATRMVTLLIKARVEIVNACPDSALTAAPRISLGELPE